MLVAPTISGDVGPGDEAYRAATDGLADAIDAAWTAGTLEECKSPRGGLWLDGPAEREGRVSGAARELALDMNRTMLANERDVIANGEPNVDGASGLDTASRVHEIAIPAILACGELDVAIKVRSSAVLADALPNARYRSLPGRAHLPYLEAPDEIAVRDPGRSRLTAASRIAFTTRARHVVFASMAGPRPGRAGSEFARLAARGVGARVQLVRAITGTSVRISVRLAVR